MKVSLITVCMAAAFLASGCATTPTPTSSAKQVPASRILDEGLLVEVPNSSRVIVKRDSGHMGSLCTIRVFLNGRALADVASEEIVTMHLPAGDYVLSATPNGICGGGTAEVVAHVRPPATYAYRLTFGNGGAFAVQPTAF